MKSIFPTYLNSFDSSLVSYGKEARYTKFRVSPAIKNNRALFLKSLFAVGIMSLTSSINGRFSSESFSALLASPLSIFSCSTTLIVQGSSLVPEVQSTFKFERHAGLILTLHQCLHQYSLNNYIIPWQLASV